MSVVVRFPPSNVSKQQYDSVRSELEGAGVWPEVFEAPVYETF
jgi:hypothetical protein